MQTFKLFCLIIAEFEMSSRIVITLPNIIFLMKNISPVLYVLHVDIHIDKHDKSNVKIFATFILE
jgi:hypothetical protein